MMFKIRWGEKAINFLDKLDVLLSRRIIKKMNELIENPFSKDIKKLKGENTFRFRVGDYRILLDINVKNRIIYVLGLGHRKNIYKRN